MRRDLFRDDRGRCRRMDGLHLSFWPILLFRSKDDFLPFFGPRTRRGDWTYFYLPDFDPYSWRSQIFGKGMIMEGRVGGLWGKGCGLGGLWGKGLRLDLENGTNYGFCHVEKVNELLGSFSSKSLSDIVHDGNGSSPNLTYE